MHTPSPKLERIRLSGTEKLVVFISMLLLGCGKTESPAPKQADSTMTSIPGAKYDYDTSFTVFGDPRYILRYSIIDDNGDYGERKNAVLLLTKVGSGKVEIILHDSLSSTNAFTPVIELRNFNNDAVEDVLIFSSSDVRSNVHNYLYLADTINHTLHFVKGFEEIKNAQYDSINNIIESFAVSGTDYWTFYKINANYETIDLGYSIEDSHTEEGEKQFEKEMRKIKRKEGWK